MMNSRGEFPSILVFSRQPYDHKLQFTLGISQYRLAQARAQWYQLRRLPLVGSACVHPPCNSSFVVTRGSVMPSAMDLPVRISSAQELPRNANSDSATPDEIHPTLICTVKCPIKQPQRYNALQKPISGYQPQVGSNRIALINMAVRKLGNCQVQQIVVSLITI